MSITQDAIARTIDNLDGHSLKRIAWAFGCSRKGSSEEAALEQALLRRAAETRRTEATPPRPLMPDALDAIEKMGNAALQLAAQRDEAATLAKEAVAQRDAALARMAELEAQLARSEG
jgi:hypothetical protein